MAYSNFELLTSSTFGLGTLVGTGQSGLAVLHSSLSLPLSGTDVGNFCRYNKIDGGGTVEGGALFCITAATMGGSFVNIPATKGIEMIFSARGTFNSGFTNGTSVGVFVKNVNLGRGTVYGLFGSGGGGEGFYGYGLRLGNLTNYTISQSAIHVGLWARNNNVSLQSNITSLPGGLGTVAYDKWYTMKLTVTPSGVLQDELRAYVLTGSDIDNPADFTEIASLSIPNTSLAYVPWTSTTSRNGFYFSRGSPTNAGSNNQAGHAWYIDRFSCKLKNI